MHCAICETQYETSPNMKGSGCPNLRKHPAQIKKRLKEKFKELNYDLDRLGGLIRKQAGSYHFDLVFGFAELLPEFEKKQIENLWCHYCNRRTPHPNGKCVICKTQSYQHNKQSVSKN